MDKQEPRIIAGDFSNEELLEWMRGKVSSSSQLKAALAEKECLLQALAENEKLILELTSSAALELLSTNQGSTLLP